MPSVYIKQTSAPLPSHDDAGDHLGAMRSLPGFTFGFIEPHPFRVVSFHTDVAPTMPLQACQERVTGTTP